MVHRNAGSFAITGMLRVSKAIGIERRHGGVIGRRDVRVAGEKIAGSGAFYFMLVGNRVKPIPCAPSFAFACRVKRAAHPAAVPHNVFAPRYRRGPEMPA